MVTAGHIVLACAAHACSAAAAVRRTYREWLHRGAVHGVLSLSVYDLAAVHRTTLFKLTLWMRVADALLTVLGLGTYSVTISSFTRAVRAVQWSRDGDPMSGLVRVKTVSGDFLGRTAAEALLAAGECGTGLVRYKVATITPGHCDVTATFNRYIRALRDAGMRPFELLVVAYIDGMVPLSALVRPLSSAGVGLQVTTLETLHVRRFDQDDAVVDPGAA